MDKSKIFLLGTANDRHTRTKNEREDNVAHQNRIARVREWIFGGMNLASVHIKRMLESQSQTPTQVSVYCDG